MFLQKSQLIRLHLWVLLGLSDLLLLVFRFCLACLPLTGGSQYVYDFVGVLSYMHGLFCIAF